MSTLTGISIIVCTWNRAHSLRSTLQSINAQSVSDAVDIEVIVVDNNSTVESPQVVESMRGVWRIGRLIYVFEPQQGKQFALNHGISVSSKAILAFTDDDITLEPNWLRNIGKAFEDSDLDLAGGKTLPVWPASGQPRWYHPGMVAVVAGVDEGDIPRCPAPEGFAPGGSNLIARRVLFDRVGKFSEAHYRHMDFEFGMRCARAGAKIAYLPELVVYAPVAAATLTKRYFRRWSFKAGIAREAEPGNASPQLLLVPRWLIRQAFEDFGWLLLHGFPSESAEAFYRELRMRRAIGTIASRWRAKLRPSTYDRWVEKYSQKTKDLY